MTDADPAQLDNGQRPLIQLILDVDPDGHAAAYLPVRWRLTPELLSMLRERRYNKPYLLITVRNERTTLTLGEDHYTEWRETSHYLVPLRDEMTYISFGAHGHNQVLATVIDLSYDSAPRTVAGWVNPKGSCESLYEQDGAPSYKFGREGVLYIDTRAVQDVIVDREMFAADPPRWQRRLVGMFYERKPHDECHFRRRLIVSGLVFLPLLIVVGIPVRLVTMAAYLFGGMRNIDWNWLKPLDLDATPRSYDGRGSIWVHDNRGRAKPWFYWTINPVVLVGGPLITWAAINFMLVEHHGASKARYRIITWDLLHTIFYVDGVFLGLTLVGFILMGVAWLGRAVISKVRPAQKTGKALVYHMSAEEAERAAMLVELETMTYADASMQARMDALPKRKRTLRLRYSKVKGWVCRPFSQ